MGKAKIKLDKDLLEKVKKFARLAGYSSPEEFVAHCLEKEISQLEEGNGLGDLITAKLIRMDIGSWNDEKALMALLKELWEREQRARNVPDELIKSYLSMDDESFLLELEGLLLTESKK